MIQIEPTELKHSVQVVRHAIGGNSRPLVLQGMHVRAGFGLVIFTATDGHRIARYIAKGAGSGEFLASREEVGGLHSGDLSLNDISEKPYRMPTVRLEQILAVHGPRQVVSNRKELLDALNGLEIVTLEARPDGTPLLKKYPGDPLPTDPSGEIVSLNAKYLRAILRRASSETTLLNYTGAKIEGRKRIGLEPVRVTFPDDPQFLGVVAPFAAPNV